MATKRVRRILQTLPVALKVWKELADKESNVGACVKLMSEFDVLSDDRPARRAVAAEWLKVLPTIFQLCEKLPGRTDMLCHYINMFPVLMQISRNLPEGDSPFVHQSVELSAQPVIREEYLVDVSRGKRVLHIGFLDAPFTEERVRSKELLHLRIRSVASDLYGIDSNQAWLTRYRDLTNDTNNAAGDIHDLTQSREHVGAYDLILLPEILEHLGNPRQALETLRAMCLKNPGARLCLTVPNAYYAGNLLRALCGEEIVHPEHYYYFSPATLSRLLRDAGFNILDMTLYASRDSAALPGITKNGVIAMCGVA
jgi:hypothetical protein